MSGFFGAVIFSLIAVDVGLLFLVGKLCATEEFELRLAESLKSNSNSPLEERSKISLSRVIGAMGSITMASTLWVGANVAIYEACFDVQGLRGAIEGVAILVVVAAAMLLPLAVVKVVSCLR